MVRKAKYTEALPVYETPAMRDRIKRIADDYEVSQAQVVRDILAIGIETAEKTWPPLD